MLDVLAGVSEDKMIECHGHFRTASCTSCSRPFDDKECKHIIVEKKRAPVCKACGGYVKPDIVFFGEDLPSKYHKMVKHDMKKADLLIVMGTCEYY
jgi:NAD-dependent SIR2 family protein deacetylase